MRAVAYVRVSTDDQGLGLEAQREAIRTWAARSGAEVVAETVDQGVSGAAPLERRPGLVAALRLVKAHRAEALVVARRDRLARDPLVAGAVEASVRRARGRVVSTAGEGAGDGPADVLLRRVIDAVAEHERAMISIRTSAALRAKMKRGEPAGGTPPYGWRLSVDGTRLEVHPEERNAVELAVDLRLRQLRTWRAIADELDRRGLPCRGSRWHTVAVRRIVARWIEAHHP